MTATSNLTRPVLPQEFLDQIIYAFYVNSTAFKAFGSPEDWANRGNNVNWTVDIGTSTNNGTSVSEGGALPAANDSAMAEAAVALSTYATKGTITDQVIWRAVNGTGNSETEKRKNELINAVNSGLMSLFEASVDSTGSYGGLTRSSYASALVSGESTYGAGSIAASNLETAIEWLQTSTDGGRNVTALEDMVILAESTPYFDILKFCEPSTSHVQQDGSDFGTLYSGGKVRTFNSIPVVHGIGLTSGNVFIGSSKVVSNYESITPQLRPLDNEGILQTVYSVVWDGCLVNKEPAQWYKLETA